MQSSPDESPQMVATPANAETGCTIGVAMSGGGYRAAAYHLGTISYLERLGKLSDVQAISTVSGGTFTGARYVLSLIEKESFRDFFDDYYAFLRDTDLLDKAIRKLGPGRSHNHLPRQLAIDAFAQVYAETLLKKKNGTPFLMGEVLDTPMPLTDVIFNSTDFRQALGFRFQKTKGLSIFGNWFERVSIADARNLRVADIVAASSCFPGGFEPIAYPQSFHHSGSAGKVGSSPKDQLPLMDGGVYDNQGIESLLLAEHRSEPKSKNTSEKTSLMAASANRFQMMIISDTDRLDDEIYSFPTPMPEDWFTARSLQFLWCIFWVILVLCGIAGLMNAWELIQDFTSSRPRNGLKIVTHGMSMVLEGLVVWLGIKAWCLIFFDLGPKVPHWNRIRNDLKYLTLHQVMEMVQLRVGSLFVLANNIFMKRIRSLLYEQLFSDETLKMKTVTSMIYKLRKFATNQSGAEQRRFQEAPVGDWPFDDLPDIPKPSPLLLDVVDAAVKMPTTLWFDDADKPTLPKLVAAGHATLCFQLMSYLVWTYGSDVDKFPETEKNLWFHLKNDWTLFQTNPYFVLQGFIPTAVAFARTPAVNGLAVSSIA